MGQPVEKSGRTVRIVPGTRLDGQIYPRFSLEIRQIFDAKGLRRGTGGVFQHAGPLSAPPVVWIDLALGIASRVLQQAGPCSEPGCVTDHPRFADHACARVCRYEFTRLRFASGTSVACRSDPRVPSENAPEPSQPTHASVMASHFSAACVYPDERAVAIWENRYAGSAPIGHRA